MRARLLFVPLVALAVAVAVPPTASAHQGGNGRHDRDQHEGEHDPKGHDREDHDEDGDAWSPVTRQDFTLTSDISEEGGSVVASGAINATGDDVVISDTEDHFIFPDGTLTVFHAPVRTKQHFDQEECTGSFREQGRYVISSGTGQYEGFSGSGEYEASGSFENGCEGQTPTGTVTVTAEGSINLPSSEPSM